MILRSLLLSAIAIASFSAAGAVTIDHDKVQPFAQPEPVTVSEKTAVKFKPSLHIVDGCHPYPAVNAAGETSAGLKGSGRIDGKCKGSALGSQVYGRAIWYKDLWAIVYGWYFPKDKVDFLNKGQRHKWVSAVVWLDNPAVETPKILAISTWNVKGGYDILKNEPPECYRYGCDPKFVEYINMTTPMLSYVRSLEEPVHTLRPTTARGTGELQDLVMWEQLSEEARIALGEADFGEKSPVPFIDTNLNANLEAARPFL
ncbi:necrosis inducing-like protein NPP1 type [Phytophthora sojae]|uniref:Necrosis inducing-like protein NPP1 type n=1 Tax=Phytophthora sojae (strain P6497) TaxID=1094619 RepID=G4ZFP9_PHYSP|nr:necrosis inducing-like protein NPP1 type [Phytophthora sojae]EGZ18517.1 necrosis inducing-like protein NPP1 type [Phytophthora sojae]|eukprot:XP_009527575.1 necrosis inducing-like protein NPP1 type [Phytophthora sojae]